MRSVLPVLDVTLIVLILSLVSSLRVVNNYRQVSVSTCLSTKDSDV